MKNEIFGKLALCRYGAELIDRWAEQEDKLLVSLTAEGHQIYLVVQPTEINGVLSDGDLKSFEDNFVSQIAAVERKAEDEVWYHFCKTDFNFTRITASLIPYATKDGFVIENVNELQSGMPEIFDFLKDNNWFNVAMYVKSDGKVVIA